MKYLNGKEEVSAQINNLADYPTSRRTARTHKILMVEINNLVTEYQIVLPEEAFAAGATIEYCGYDGLVTNCDTWKNEFDILVVSSLNTIGYIVNSTPAQIKAAIQTFMAAGVFIIWYAYSTAASIEKYGPNGTVDAAQTVVLTDVFSIARTSRDILGGTRTFSHSATYPFGSTEILRTECIPNNGYLGHYTSSDPLVNFPIVASNGTNNANCVAYKPGVFMIIADAGSGTATTNTDAYWKYLLDAEVIRIALGKTTQARVAIGYAYGKLIAAVGVDCCTEATEEVYQTYKNSFKGKPLEFGRVATQIEDNPGFHRKILENSGFESCSHTDSHWLATPITVTDEAHVIGADQMIWLNNQGYINITSLKKSDDSVTYTKCATKTINSSVPTATEYAVYETTDAGTHMMHPGVKFHVNNIGVSVKVTYTYVKEYEENIGSVRALQAIGCATNPAIFGTAGFDCYSPTTLKAIKNEGITLCGYGEFPKYVAMYNLCRTTEKMPLLVDTVAKEGYNHVVKDTQYFLLSDAAARTCMTTAIARSVAKDMPLAYYIHGQLMSDTDPASLHNNAAYHGDWKKATPALTRENATTFMLWYIALFDAAGAYWLSRSGFAKRYYYLNKYLKYDVEEETTGTTLIISNTGNEKINGLTVRVPCASTPSSVTLFKDQAISYTYADGIATAWFDLYPGETVALAVVF